MLVSEVRRMSKIKRGILFIVILAVFLVTSSVGMEYYVVHQLNGEVTGRNRPFAALTVEPEDTLDMLVAGDSESYNSVSTMRLWEDKGIAAYDCGQGAQSCLLYTSDAADEEDSVDLGGRRIIKKKRKGKRSGKL